MTREKKGFGSLLNTQWKKWLWSKQIMRNGYFKTLKKKKSTIYFALINKVENSTFLYWGRFRD